MKTVKHGVKIIQNLVMLVLVCKFGNSEAGIRGGGGVGQMANLSVLWEGYGYFVKLHNTI